MFLPLVEPGGQLPVEEVARYSRHLLLPGIGTDGQRRLRNARVLVVGAGGLGSPILLYLAGAGVGTIGVVDDDVVEESNLQRQLVHGRTDLGRAKVDSAAEAVVRANPDVTVERHHERLTAHNALDLLKGYDLVLDGTDSFDTRYLVNDACAILGKPYVWGSIFRFHGQISVFWADPPTLADGTSVAGVTYRDLHPEPPPAGLVPSCGEGGVLGALCGVIGSAMATEAVKLICGVGEPLLGRVLVFDALAAQWRTLAVRPAPTAIRVTSLLDADATPPAGPDPAQAPSELAPTELARMLASRERGEGDFLLIDVREPAERAIVDIPGAVGVPIDRFRGGDGVLEVQSLAAGRRVILYCKSGARSAEALAVLTAAGLPDAAHLSGGVLAWIDDVDPGLPRY